MSNREPVQHKSNDRHYEDFMKPKKIEEGGVIRLSGKFLLDHEDEIVNLVRHESDLAKQHDPKVQLVGIEKKDGVIAVVVSDHNLANHLGKALAHAYKGEPQYKYFDNEKYVEVEWHRD